MPAPRSLIISPLRNLGYPFRQPKGRTVTGNDDTTASHPTPPGETRFWCSCDPDRQHPFYSSATLLRHVMDARAVLARKGNRDGGQAK
jgi:hypothetical protein